MKKSFKFRLSVWQFLAIAYLLGTLLGSALLSLPFATKSGEEPTSYVNALFTSASAVSMTGLAPYDTATHWTLFGQLVILFLMQMSGLGFMTLVSAMFLIFKRGLGFGSKNAFVLDSRGKYNGVGTLLKRIVIGTFIFETIGALILMIRFIPDFGVANGIYFSVWHSVSAFCNAGFDMLGTAQNGGFVSLTPYVADPLVTLTLSALIIIGSLGFAVWGDIIDCKCRFKKFQLNTKVVLIVNLILIAAGTGLFLLFERNNEFYESLNLNFGQRLLASFFNAVTPRSAGFFSTKLTSLSESGYVLTVILMFIGGGSGSTAGGLRVGTFAVITMGMIANFRKSKDICIGKKRIEHSLLSEALAILATLIAAVIVSTVTICTIEPQAAFKDILFECVSALSNSGLGVVNYSKTTVATRLIITLLMYAGRVGVLNLALAFGENRKAAAVRRPVDTLLIG